MIVGIDPNRCMFAVNILDELTGENIAWYESRLKRKDKFENAQKWQEYILHEVDALFNRIYQECRFKPPILVVTEQQRGRVMAIMEQTLFVCAKKRHWNIVIKHPQTWKKETQLHSGGGNKKNKIEAEKRIKPMLEIFLQRNIDKKERIHDLCDARLLAESGIRKDPKTTDI